jgi:hypothetical protein
VAKALDIRPVQAYLDDILKITITIGRASASGTVTAGYGAGGPRLSYRGSSALSGFSTIDKLNREEFIKWDSLALNGMEFDLTPMRLFVKSVALSNFYSNIVMGRDGRLNIREVMERAPQGPGSGAPPLPRAPRQAADIRIDSATLKGGRWILGPANRACLFSEPRGAWRQRQGPLPQREQDGRAESIRQAGQVRAV